MVDAIRSKHGVADALPDAGSLGGDLLALLAGMFVERRARTSLPCSPTFQVR